MIFLSFIMAAADFSRIVPDDALCHMFSLIRSTKTLVVLRCVCTRWKRLAERACRLRGRNVLALCDKMKQLAMLRANRDWLGISVSFHRERALFRGLGRLDPARVLSLTLLNRKQCVWTERKWARFLRALREMTSLKHLAFVRLPYRPAPNRRAATPFAELLESLPPSLNSLSLCLRCIDGFLDASRRELDLTPLKRLAHLEVLHMRGVFAQSGRSEMTLSLPGITTLSLPWFTEFHPGMFPNISSLRLSSPAISSRSVSHSVTQLSVSLVNYCYPPNHPGDFPNLQRLTIRGQQCQPLSANLAIERLFRHPNLHELRLRKDSVLWQTDSFRAFFVGNKCHRWSDDPDDERYMVITARADQPSCCIMSAGTS